MVFCVNQSPTQITLMADCGLKVTRTQTINIVKIFIILKEGEIFFYLGALNGPKITTIF